MLYIIGELTGNFTREIAKTFKEVKGYKIDFSPIEFNDTVPVKHTVELKRKDADFLHGIMIGKGFTNLSYQWANKNYQLERM